MMLALLSKELRALRPIVWCIVGLSIFSCVYLLSSELPDDQTLHPEMWAEKMHDGTFIVLMLFCTMIGANLLTQESDQGTLRFLDGLPLNRSQLFLSKIIAALLVIALIPGSDLLTTVVFDAFSRTSIDGPFPWRFSLVMAGLQIVAGAFLLAMASLISFSRAWFALIAGLVFWTFLWLRQMDVEWIAYIDPYALLKPDLVSGTIVIPWPQVGAHLAATAGCLGVALLAFARMGDDAQHTAERLGRNPLLRGFGIGFRLLGPVIWLGALIYISVKSHDVEAESAAENTPVGEEAFGRRETKRYEFLFRKSQESDADALMRNADDVHDKVATFLEASPAPTRFVVDLASPVISHAVGQTNWTKIRMPIASEESLVQLRRILGHETTHAFIEQFGNGRLSAPFNSIRCLHEGLATYVEQSLFAPEQVTRHRNAVAGAWSRGKVPFSLLVDNRALSRTRDPNLVYPLGAELAGALIDTYGRGAPARFLRAVGRPKAPIGLEGAELWRDALQFSGMSLERVAASYESRCAAIAEEGKTFVDTLPRISAEAGIEGNLIVIRPKFSGSAPGKILCFVEDDEPFGIGVRALRPENDGTFTMERSKHLKKSLRYMLGWKSERTDLPIFEPWSEAAL